MLSAHVCTCTLLLQGGGGGGGGGHGPPCPPPLGTPLVLVHVLVRELDMIPRMVSKLQMENRSFKMRQRGAILARW